MENNISYDEAFAASKKYFNGDELAAKVVVDKYLLKDKENNLVEKMPSDKHRRMAKEFARVEEKKYKNTKIKPFSEDEIFGFFDKYERVVPQGSPMYGVGNIYQTVSCANCFILAPTEDSYGGVLKTDEEIVQISKRRGGIGAEITNVRPKGTPTENSSKTSTGIVTFMERFSNSIREVGQDGRRGAGIITISVNHPESVIPWNEKEDGEVFNTNINGQDISSVFYNPKKLDFVTAKLDRKKITGANVSIKLTDDFMNAVKNDEYFIQKWISKNGKKNVERKSKAKDIWNKIVYAAHNSGEPGVLFWDTIIRESVSDCYRDFGFESVGVNPCGEIISNANSSCILLLLNLYNFVKNPYTKNASFDFDELYNFSIIAQRLNDDLVDIEMEAVEKIINKIKKDPEDEDIKSRELKLWKKILEVYKKGRRTGTGTTGLGDVFAGIGLEYGSEESISLASKIYKTFKRGCYRSSVDMAKEIGPFPIWDSKLESNNPFLNRLKEDDKGLYDDMNKYGRRNICLNTLSPSGSVSLLTQTTSGIEPLFMMSYTRRKKINLNDNNSVVNFVDENGDKWQHFEVYHPKILEWKKITGKTDIKESPWYKSCASDIPWEKRVKLQSVVQKEIDMSISSTINLSKDTKMEKISNIYMRAWELGCKGLTIYRDGCRDGVLIDNSGSSIHRTQAVKRPKSLECDIHHMRITKKLDKPRTFDYLVIVGLLNNDPYEVFIVENGSLPKRYISGTISKEKRGVYKLLFNDGTKIDNVIEETSDLEDSFTRLVSISLRHGVPIEYIVQQLEKTTGGEMYSFSKVVARALKKYVRDGTKVTGEVCEKCGSNDLERSSGCKICRSCGESKCK